MDENLSQRRNIYVELIEVAGAQFTQRPELFQGFFNITCSKEGINCVKSVIQSFKIALILHDVVDVLENSNSQPLVGFIPSWDIGPQEYCKFIFYA